MAASKTTSPSSSASLRKPTSPLDDLMTIVERLSLSRKAQVPYYTGWDSKPNSCWKLVADIENEESQRKKGILNRARSTLALGQKKRERQEDDVKKSEIILRKLRTSQKESSASPSKGHEQSEESIGDSFHFDNNKSRNSVYAGDDTNLTIHNYDSTFNSSDNQSLHSLSMPSPSSNQLSISEIKSESFGEPKNHSSQNVSTRSKSFATSALSSTPVKEHKSSSHEQKAAEEKSSTSHQKSGTFSLRDEDDYYDSDEDDYVPPKRESAKKTRIERKESAPTLHLPSPIHVEIEKLLNEYEENRRERWRQSFTATIQKLINTDKQLELESDFLLEKKETEEKLRLLNAKCELRRLELKANLESQLKLQKLENEQEDKQIELALNKLEEEKRRVKLEKEAAEAAAAEAALKLKEQQEQLILQKQMDQDDAAKKAQVEAATANAQRQEQLQIKEGQEKISTPTPIVGINRVTDNSKVPEEFRNAVLQTDLLNYLRLQQQLEVIKQTIQNISSSDVKTKSFYFSAMKVVNIPINSISNLSDEHLQQKIQHFVHLLEGKPVYVGDTMTSPFIVTSEPNGELFVLNMIAFRFVKKSEAEIKRGVTALTPLATLGVHLIRKFPVLGPIIRANFYKMCPFLVPLAYPRTPNMTYEQYSNALGHEQLSGSEVAIQEIILQRITGYCTLYGIMVNIIEKQNFTDLRPENSDFFSLKEIWRILVATMRLEPQFDVTCTVIQTLLETSVDMLLQVFKSQFKKLMQELSSKYLLKIRSITPPTKTAALTRLELFLEAQATKFR